MNLYLFCTAWEPTTESQPCNEFSATNLKSFNDIAGDVDALCDTHGTHSILKTSDQDDWQDWFNEAMSVDHVLCQYCGEWFLRSGQFYNHLAGESRCANSYLSTWNQDSEEDGDLSDHSAYELMSAWGISVPTWLLEVAQAEGYAEDDDLPEEDPEPVPPMEPLFIGLDTATEPTKNYVQMW